MNQDDARTGQGGLGLKGGHDITSILVIIRGIFSHSHTLSNKLLSYTALLNLLLLTNSRYS